MKKPPRTALEVSGLSVHYESSPVLWDLHVSVPTGRLVGVMGPNSAGKTTFIRAILGLAEGASGSVLLLNKPLRSVRKGVAYVPQRSSVDWDFPISVYELVEMGCYPKTGLFRRLSREDRQNITRAIELLGLKDIQHLQINQLSGGQQQRAFIARAIAQDAALYFLDEPFEGIDAVSEHLLVEVLKSMCASDKTVFVVHHNLLTAKAYFDWVILLHTKIVAAGPFASTYTQENLVKTYGEKFTLIEEVVKLSVAASGGWSTYG